MNTLEVTYEQAQENLDAVLDRALEQQGVLVIHRPGKPRVTMLAESELISLLETVHLLRSPVNAQRLFAALQSSIEDDNKPVLTDPCSLSALLEELRGECQD